MSRVFARAALTHVVTATLRRVASSSSQVAVLQSKEGRVNYGLLCSLARRTFSTTDYPPHQTLEMPSLSPTMSQGNIAEWKKAEGEQVAAGDVLCEVETDKATIEWESVEEGYLAKILLADGSKDVPVGTVVAVLCEEEGDVSKFASYLPSTSEADKAADEAASVVEETAPSKADTPALNLPSHTVLDMPSLSPTMTQGSLSSWKKKEGDAIEAGEILAEVETDKATIEWEAVDGGYLAKIFVADGTSDIEIGTPVAIVCDDEQDLPAFANLTADLMASGASPASLETADKPSSQPVAAPATVAPKAAPKSAPPKAAALVRRTGHIAASPLAKSIASESGLDLALVVGTGPEGRVIAADVREYLESKPALEAVQQQQAVFSSSPLYEGLGAMVYEDVEISQMRRVIGQRLLDSKQNIPHYYLSMDCDVGALMSLRQSVNASIAESANGTKVSLNDFVIKAAALACQAVPECNAEWRDDCIRLHKSVHVGVAMDLGSLGHSQGGLVVPVVKHVHAKGVSAIAKDVKTYASKAKALEGADGKMRLSLEEMEGGTFTVSNLGMFGVKQFAAIINPPQSCILAVGTIRSEVKKAKGTEEEAYEEAKMMNVTLSCDHRVVDGAVGAKWLQHFKELVENPLQMLI